MNPEAVKYARMWDEPAYRAHAPGEWLVPFFLSLAKPGPGATVLDLGCGTGRAGLALARAGLDVTLVDFAPNCLDPAVRAEVEAGRLRFVEADLERPLPVAAQYAFCSDVLEHIRPQAVDAVLDQILRAAQHVFLSIATFEDSCGDLIGERLHLTVRPYAWWLEQFARRECVIGYSADVGSAAVFYLSAWTDGQTLVDAGRLNCTESQIRAHVEANLAAGWATVAPHVEQPDVEVMLLGGGPSLAAFEAEIRARRADGAKLVTLNGAYTWALERGLRPSATVVVDAREFNRRFTKPVVEDCRYLIASQCHPGVLEGLPRDRTWLWHTSMESIRDLLDAHGQVYYAIPGGSTVLLRAIPLLRLLGYRKFHLYGCDSCLAGPQRSHHAYAQPENDRDLAIAVTLAGSDRLFWCYPWMVGQAQEFQALIRHLGDQIELAVHGDGLLAHLLETGARLAPADPDTPDEGG